MKMNHNLAVALLMGLASGEFRNAPSCTSGNRLHRERAPAGSAEESERIAAADAKRARQRLKRLKRRAS